MQGYDAARPGCCIPGNRESQSAAVAGRAWDAIKRFEDLLPMRDRYSRAGVDDLHDGVLALAPDPNGDLTPSRRVGERIVQSVLHDEPQRVGPPYHLAPIDFRQPQVDTPGFSLGDEFLHDFTR